MGEGKYMLGDNCCTAGLDQAGSIADWKTDWRDILEEDSTHLREYLAVVNEDKEESRITFRFLTWATDRPIL